MVVLFTIFILMLANLAQVTSVRQLGPPLASSFQPLRLASTTLGSGVVLDEPVSGTIVWIGLVIMGAVLSAFSYFQAKPAELPEAKRENGTIQEVVELTASSAEVQATLADTTSTLTVVVHVSSSAQGPVHGKDASFGALVPAGVT